MESAFDVEVEDCREVKVLFQYRKDEQKSELVRQSRPVR